MVAKHKALIALCIALLFASSNAQNTTSTDDGEDTNVAVEVFRYAAIVVLIMMSGLFSGLTLGLLGLDTNQLEIIRDADPGSADAIAAAKIYPVRKSGNLLLCTLLLGNVAVNSLLSILLADLTSGLVGFLSSTILIVLFGEIIPQASCSRHALYIGSKTIPIVKVFVVLLWIVAKPISMILDKVLGDEIGTIHSHSEFHQLLRLHQQHNAIDDQEFQIMSGALNVRSQTVGHIMTPWDKAFTIKADDKLDYDMMCKIFKSGYSRIPVVDPNARETVVGLLYSKDLILIVPADRTPVINVIEFFNRRRVNLVDESLTIGDLLTHFSTTRQHFAMVQGIDASDETKDPEYHLKGLVTMEDVLEEILKKEIEDEFDDAEGDDSDRPSTAQQFDYAHLRLLDQSRRHNDLKAQEVAAVAAYLQTNVTVFKQPHPQGVLTLDMIKELVKGSRVLEIVQAPRKDGAPIPSSHWLYERDERIDVCTLILSGNVEVLSGQDEIQTTMGTWDVLAPKALVQDDYRTDFSARCTSERVRCLRIGRSEFNDMLRFDRGPASAPTAGAVAEPAAVGVELDDHERPRDPETLSQLAGSADAEAHDRVAREGIPRGEGIGLIARPQRHARRKSSTTSATRERRASATSADSAKGTDDMDVVVNTGEES